MPEQLITHTANANGRDFVVGDIHGQLDRLKAAMAHVDFDKKRDRLFSVGDLVDRGKDSYACLELLFEPYFFAVRGNHEQMALDALRAIGGAAWDNWISNGGEWIYHEDVHEVQVIFGEAVKYLPFAREITLAGGKRVGLVHAEPPQDWKYIHEALRRQPASLIWNRSRFKNQDITQVGNIDAVLVGHTTVDAPLWLGNVAYLDTGAFTKEGSLTLVEIQKLLQTNSIEAA